jgi:hypothetical protein
MRFNDARTDTLVTEGWTHDVLENRIIFETESIPPEGTTIYLSYPRSTRHPSEQDEPVEEAAR